MYLMLDIATATVFGLGTPFIIYLLIADSKQFPCANGHVGPFTRNAAGRQCEKCGITTIR